MTTNHVSRDLPWRFRKDGAQGQVPALFRPPKNPRPVYFGPSLSSQDEADQLWHECIAAIQRGIHSGITPSLRSRSNGLRHQLLQLIGVGDRIVRFWVRDAITNELVIVGNAEGLFPLDVEPLHG